MALETGVTDVNSQQNGVNPNTGIGPPQNQKPDSKKGAHTLAKQDKDQANPTPMQTNNPTVASTAGGKTILDAIKQVDPGNVSGFIKKAVDAMMMIRSIDAASGVGGGGAGGGGNAATTSAALASGMINTAQLLETAEQLGLKQVLDALNAIMPELIPMLDNASIAILDEAILGIITNTNVGVLSPLAVQSSQATAAAIAQVNSLSVTSTPSQVANAVVTAVQTIGGGSLNLDPNSLAAMIVSAAVGTTITNTMVLNGVNVAVTVHIDSSFIMDQLSNIPSFTGTEPQDIATAQATQVATQLSNFITTNTLTATNFFNLLTGLQANVQSAGLQQVLGTDLNGILGQIQNLISQFAGNITDSENNHQPRGRLNTVTQALQGHSKILSLIKKKIDISDIFQSMGGQAGQALSQVQSAMSSIQSAVNSSGIASALNASEMVASTTNVTNVLQNILQSAQNPLTAISADAANALISSGTSMLGQLTSTQVQSLLGSFPPSLVLSLIGSGTAMFSNMSTQQIINLLNTLPSSTVASLLQGNDNLSNFASAGSSYAEQTSDISAALASVISTQPLGTILTAVLPNGTTVTCTVISIASPIPILVLN